MSFNLIHDAWIPVITAEGPRRIAPWQMADLSIQRLDWPRADLNLACLELLIGLVFLADPPEDIDDWDDRQTPDPARLRDRLAPLQPAFDLLGDGPRFLQDREDLKGEPNPPDMLFIDSAGGQTVRNNADLMVWRDRYPTLDPALAAMALYTFQAFAPAGGAGNRTSMRGGGPLLTLVQPQGGLWATIWANVPYGAPADASVLPWMRATVTSDGGRAVYPEQTHPAEAFFGMPRRLRLVGAEGGITGVIQRPYGTNYAGWDHPLTPYYRLKAAEEWLPKHPRAGLFGYRHWLGVVMGAEGDRDGLQRRALALRNWSERGGRRGARVLVAGWAMDNMKPRDFILSTPPLVQLQGRGLASLTGMIEAADILSLELRRALAPVLAEGESREALREAFYAETQADFETGLSVLAAGGDPEGVARDWVAALRRVALRLFETRALPSLTERDIEAQQDIIKAHGQLGAAFAGYGAAGAKAYGALTLPVPVPAKRKKETA